MCQLAIALQLSGVSQGRAALSASVNKRVLCPSSDFQVNFQAEFSSDSSYTAKCLMSEIMIMHALFD